MEAVEPKITWPTEFLTAAVVFLSVSQSERCNAFWDGRRVFLQIEAACKDIFDAVFIFSSVWLQAAAEKWVTRLWLSPGCSTAAGQLLHFLLLFFYQLFQPHYTAQRGPLSCINSAFYSAVFWTKYEQKFFFSLSLSEVEEIREGESNAHTHSHREEMTFSRHEISGLEEEDRASLLQLCSNIQPVSKFKLFHWINSFSSGGCSSKDKDL